MKKCIWLLLVVLLLAGCAAQEAETIPVTTEAPTVPTGIYLPDSSLEKDTQGAIRAYGLADRGYYDLALMGNKLLVLGSDGLVDAFSGEELVPAGSVELGQEAAFGTAAVSMGDLGVFYYKASKNQVICLNPVLTVTDTVDLPEDAVGAPAICPEKEEIYYSAGSQIRALNMKTGISRMIRSFNEGSLTIDGVHFAGAILECTILKESGATEKVYLSAETGQTLSQDSSIYSMVTHGDSYFLQRMDGITQQLLFGTMKGQPRQLHISGSMIGLPALDGVVAWEGTQDGLSLELYDLEKGVLKAKISVPGMPEPMAMVGDPDSGYIWFLADAGEGVGLYRWEFEKSILSDTRQFTTPAYTPENPDLEGLAACAQRAEELSQQYGVEICIWEDALADPGAYAFVGEHQTGPILSALDAMEDVFSIFPQDVFTESMPQGKVKIFLVRSISGGEKAVHYWKDKGICIALTADSDLGHALLRQIAFAIDSRCTVYSTNYDLWNKLNPSGFSYDLDYALTQQRDDTQYLTGEDRAFADKRSMSFPSEDRCAIFVYACQNDTAELFQAPILQKKLYEICTAIREAYGLEKHPEPFLWEQYLEEPLVKE